MELDIPPEWEALVSDMTGLVMLVGAPDTGKSTLARYWFERAAAAGKSAAYLDGDAGQSTLGPPTTLTLLTAAGSPPDLDAAGPLPAPGRTWRTFVGSVSPRGHMLPLLTGTARLVAAARSTNTDLILYDTDGLVSPSGGGVSLKLALIDLLRPAWVVALQRDTELLPLLQPLRRTRRTRLLELKPSPQARRRSTTTRQAHRARQFGRYFARAAPQVIHWPQYAVFPQPRFTVGRIVGLEDALGYLLALGIVTQVDSPARRVTLLTPWAGNPALDALVMGDTILDPATFRDRSA